MKILILIYKIIFITNIILFLWLAVSLFFTVFIIGWYWGSKLDKALERNKKHERLKELKKINYHPENLRLYEEYLKSEKDNDIIEIKEIKCKNLKIVSYISFAFKFGLRIGLINAILSIIGGIYNGIF